MSEQKRSSKRFPIQASARYLKDGAKEWKDCFIMDIGHGGLGILMAENGAVSIGKNLTLEMNIDPEKARTSGTIRWTKKLLGKCMLNRAIGISFNETGPVSGNTFIDYAASKLIPTDQLHTHSE